jgi:hypothetical protein
VLALKHAYLNSGSESQELIYFRHAAGAPNVLISPGSGAHVLQTILLDAESAAAHWRATGAENRPFRYAAPVPPDSNGSAA